MTLPFLEAWPAKPGRVLPRLLVLYVGENLQINVIHMYQGLSTNHFCLFSGRVWGILGTVYLFMSASLQDGIGIRSPEFRARWISAGPRRTDQSRTIGVPTIIV